MFYRKKGFTLLELMIVVIIIGILATLALPRFLRAAARARWAAAASTLGVIRNAQARYYADHDSWATIVDAAGTQLDIGIADTPNWDIQNPAGTDAEIGQVQQIGGAAQVYTIASDGTITPAQP